MKTITFLLVLLSFFTPAALQAEPQKTVQYGDLVFGSTHGMWCVNTSVAPDKLPALRPSIQAKIAEHLKTKVHPFNWSYPDPRVEFFWVVNGTLPNIQKALKEADTTPSWIWVGIDRAKLVEIKITLHAQGPGHIDLVQEGQTVGHFRCQSGPRAKQPAAGTCSINDVCTERGENGELGRTSRKWDSWMPGALGIKNTVDGCYIHGGDITTQSDGCIRIGRLIALHHLRPLVKEGTSVVITHL